MQLYFSPVSYLRAVPGRRQLMTPDPFPGMLLGLSNCRPTSRGSMSIRSPDPFDPPRIEPNYLDTAEDMAEMLEGVRFLRQLAATRPLAEVIAGEMKPGAAVEGDEALVADIRARAGTCSTLGHLCDGTGPGDGGGRSAAAGARAGAGFGSSTRRSFRM